MTQNNESGQMSELIERILAWRSASEEKDKKQSEEIRNLRAQLPGGFDGQFPLGPGTTGELVFRALLKVDREATNAQQARQSNLAAARIVVSEPGRWVDDRKRGRRKKIADAILNGALDGKKFWTERSFRKLRSKLQAELNVLGERFPPS